LNRLPPAGSSSTKPSGSNAVAGAGHKYKSTGAIGPVLSSTTGFYTRGQRAVVPELFSSERKNLFFDRLPSKQAVFFCFLDRSAGAGAEANHSIKKEPLLRGLDDHRILTELDQYVLDAVAGKQDLIRVFSVEGFFQLRPHLDEGELIGFFYNVGSHDTWF
jgi:hypothetical protein